MEDMFAFGQTSGIPNVIQKYHGSLIIRSVISKELHFTMCLSKLNRLNNNLEVLTYL